MSLTDNTRSLSLLPPPVRTKIRSTQILTSLPQVISELVQNSLDANSHHIEVGVDCEEWECWVKDDGEGMSKEGMGMLRKAEEEGRYSKLLPATLPKGWNPGPDFMDQIPRRPMRRLRGLTRRRHLGFVAKVILRHFIPSVQIFDSPRTLHQHWHLQ